MYKFEIHLHSSGCSGCAVSDSIELVEAAKKHGYSGVVFTNHFYRGNTALDRKLPWEEFVTAYEQDYLKAKEYGVKIGIKVFFGVEEVFAAGKEMLIYGVSPETFKKTPEFRTMNAFEKADFVHRNGGVTVCAHPFRSRSYIPDPDTPPDISLFDGIECYNRGNKHEENEKAFSFTEKTSLFMTSGGDVHGVDSFGKTGIAFDTPIETEEDFIKNLKSGNFTLLIP